MNILLQILLNALAFYISARILPGVMIADYTTAIIASVVLGVINAFLKPVLVILTLPVTCLTLGLFYIFINVFLLQLVDRLVSGFSLDNWWTALIFGLVYFMINRFFHALRTDDKDDKHDRHR